MTWRQGRRPAPVRAGRSCGAGACSRTQAPTSPRTSPPPRATTPAAAHDRAGHAAAVSEVGVGGVDNSVDVLLGEIAIDKAERAPPREGVLHHDGCYIFPRRTLSRGIVASTMDP